MKSAAFLGFCKNRGIELDPPPAYSPEGNSAIESVWRGWAEEAKTTGSREWDLTILDFCYVQNNKLMRRYGNVSASMIDTGKGVDNVEELRRMVRETRRSLDAKVIPNAPVFVVGEEVDLWKPSTRKTDVCFFGATVVRAEHPTYYVRDEQQREIKVSVRRLRKIPHDPFAEEEEKKDGGSGSDSDDEDSVEDAKYQDPPNEKLLSSIAIGDFVPYRDGHDVYGGLVTNLYAEAEIVEFQEMVFVKKGHRVKAERTWIDADGVVVQSNYRPQRADPILYKTDMYALVDKVTLDTGSLLPAAVCDANPIVISQPN